MLLRNTHVHESPPECQLRVGQAPRPEGLQVQRERAPIVCVHRLRLLRRYVTFVHVKQSLQRGRRSRGPLLAPELRCHFISLDFRAVTMDVAKRLPHPLAMVVAIVDSRPQAIAALVHAHAVPAFLASDVAPRGVRSRSSVLLSSITALPRVDWRQRPRSADGWTTGRHRSPVASSRACVARPHCGARGPSSGRSEAQSTTGSETSNRLRAR